MAAAKQKAPAAAQKMAANRPQGQEIAASDGGKTPPQPKAKVGSDARRMSDCEQAQPLQQLDPPHRLSTPSDLKPDTAHGHSPHIDWPKDAQSDAPRPFKNLR